MQLLQITTDNNSKWSIVLLTAAKQLKLNTNTRYTHTRAHIDIMRLKKPHNLLHLA